MNILFHRIFVGPLACSVFVVIYIEEYGQSFSVILIENAIADLPKDKVSFLLIFTIIKNIHESLLVYSKKIVIISC